MGVGFGLQRAQFEKEKKKKTRTGTRNMRLPGYYKTNGRSVHLAGHLRHEAVFGMMSAGLLMLSSSARMFYSPFIPPVAPKRAPCGIEFSLLEERGLGCLRGHTAPICDIG